MCETVTWWGQERFSPQDIQDQTFIPALLRYSWHKILFKVYMIWYTLTPPSPHLTTLFFCCKIILRSTHRAIFMDIIQYHYYSHHVLDIRFPELTHLIAGSQYPLPSTSPYISSKLHLTVTNLLCLYAFGFSKLYIKDHKICLGSHSQGPSMFS